uniref:RING-type domain-containing protein n=1 Tax=Strongyloides stercoralis TaxID=6248 RepID=A0A0K0DVV6_STRER
MLICNICCEAYTGPGTEHAIYSTICGHLMGKSCLEKWRTSKNTRNFTCPRCNKKLSKKDCHPIYDLPDEFFKPINENESLEKIITDEDIKNEYLKLNSTMEAQFIKRIEKDIGGECQLLDVYNGYLLLVGYTSLINLKGQFLKIINCQNGEIYYSTNIGDSNCTAVAFNKFKTDVIEYMIGFKNGILWHTTISLENSNNIVNKQFTEINPINSICFLGPEKYAYSAGSGCVYVTDTSGRLRKNNWYRIEIGNSEIVTNLQNLSECAVIGIAKGKIYVFEENEQSYTLCSDYVFHSKENEYGEYISTTQSYVLRRITQTLFKDKVDSSKYIYSAFTRKMVPNKDGKFPVPLYSNLIVEDIDDENIYECSLIPNIKTQALEIIHITTTPQIVGKEAFENMENCLGVNFINKPKWLLESQLLKLQTAVIFKNTFSIFDIYCPVK